jgi:uncharacterized membrane protein
MSLLPIAASDALPDNTGYVAAAYLVFLALVLIYLVIMATKLSRFEREIDEISEIVDRRAAEERESEREGEAIGT